MRKIEERINQLRDIMSEEKLDAYYISGTDPHMSEYLPERWKTREFISGFTGSFGEVVVTKNEALLWTDTRYFLQAEEQLKGTGIQMQKLRVPDAVLFDHWLIKNLEAGSRVGVNPECLPFGTWRNLKKIFEEKGIELVLCSDLLNKLWENRPAVPKNEIIEMDVKYAGLTRKDKFQEIEVKLAESGCGLQLITALDELAWVFNLRGDDIPYNPVFLGFGMIGEGVAKLFVDPEKVPDEIAKSLKADGVQLMNYTEFYSFLKNLNDKKISFDPSSTNSAAVLSLLGNNDLKEQTSIPALLKAQKNNVELDGFRTAMKKDGAALVKFLFWLKNSIGKLPLSEYDVGLKLAEFRAEQEGFRGESFTPIVGYANHGAIVHLSVGKENANQLKPEGILLFDSGGQYWEGTTDITRTVALGTVSEKQKTDFTLVLKGVIALTNAKFPAGTKGCHLDILARNSLWQHGLNYGHGTGHGVGHYLAVHEGPMSIRQEYNPVNIEPGMVISNEPGLYREGEYGIRTENMIACVNKEETEFGKFYGFETLTLCPIDLRLINQKLLSTDEKDWINNYHQKVRDELSSLLSNELKVYLEEITPVLK